MLSIDHQSDVRTLAWETSLSARMNHYYHLELRARWARVDLWGKIGITALSAVSCLSLAEGLAWFGWASPVAFVALLALAILRTDRRIEQHASLAVRYLSHVQELERIFESGDYSNVPVAVRLYDQTEQLEAEQEGKPDRAVLKRAYAQVREEIGSPWEEAA